MIRPVTCLAFLLACGSGLYLYQAKHRVKVLDDQIAAVVKSTDTLREQTRMLNAEWTLLNDPERLRKLANQFLTLQTVSPNQFTSLADLDSRLPPPMPQGAPPASAAASPVVAEQTPTVSTDTSHPDANAAPSPTTTVAGTAPADVHRDVASSDVHRNVASATGPSKGGAASSGTASPHIASADDHATDHHAAPDVLARAADYHASPRPPAPSPRVAANPPRPPGLRDADRHAPPEQHDVALRSFVPRSVERRPVMAVRTAPMATGGSLLGMAHDMAAPPAPMPMGEPVPMARPASYGAGG